MGPSPSGTIYVTGDTDNVLYRFQEQREPTTLGDVNLDYRTDVTDALAIIGYMFLGRNEIVCAKAADFNEDGHTDIADAIAILLHLFGEEMRGLPEDVSCQ